MYDGYKNIINAQGMRSLMRSPVMPNKNLAIAGDDEMSDVPLVIFRDQHLPVPTAVTPDPSELSYEKTAVKGANDVLSMSSFVTDDFDLGAVYDSI